MKRKTIEVDLDEYIELKDLEVCAIQASTGTQHCAEGRRINSGLICPHCKAPDPDEECKGTPYNDVFHSLRKKLERGDIPEGSSTPPPELTKAIELIEREMDKTRDSLDQAIDSGDLEDADALYDDVRKLAELLSWLGG